MARTPRAFGAIDASQRQFPVNNKVFPEVDVSCFFTPNIAAELVRTPIRRSMTSALAKNMYFNLDVKKVQIRTDVKSDGTTVGEFKVDPVLFGVGIGWRF